jgi:hypothetical protein
MIEIIHDITTDGLDGQPWPPPDRDVLWRVVHHADGRTLWRAIKLVHPPVVGDAAAQKIRALSVIGRPAPGHRQHSQEFGQHRMRPAASPDMT